MGQKRRTLKQLADEAKLDVDGALVILWDAGFDDVLSPNDVFRRRDLNRVRRALGLATRRELETLDYWMHLLGLPEPELRGLLLDLGVSLDGNSRKLRHKGISRLRGEAHRRAIDPVTGVVVASDTPSKKSETGSFAWRTPGHERELRWLTPDEIRGIHFELVNDFASSSDPITPPGVRSESLLASAVFRPKTSLGGALKYPTVETSGAALLHSIIHDHPFHNGNKRTALVAMLVFLDENGFFPGFDQDEVFKLVLQVAQHRVTSDYVDDLADREVLAIADWLCTHCRVLEQGNRQIPLRRLRQILVKYGCQVHGPLGNRLEVTRDVATQSVLHRILGRKTTRLRAQLAYGGDGRDVSKKVIGKIRHDLHLDDFNGIDSRAFYSMEGMIATDFIAYYRKTLYRLAKF